MFSKPESLSPIDLHTFKIGLLTKIWASIEASLDISVSLAFNHFGGDALSHEIPRSLNNKVKMVRKTLKASEAAQRFQVAADKLLECILEAMIFRHECVHGLAMRDAETEAPTRMLLFVRHPDKITAQRKPISEQDMMDAIQEGYFLLGTTQILFHRVRCAIDPSVILGAGKDATISRQSISQFLSAQEKLPRTTKRAKRVYAAALELASSMDG